MSSFTIYNEANNELAEHDPGTIIVALMNEYGVQIQEVIAFMEKLAVVKSEGWGKVTMTVNSGVCTQIEGTISTILINSKPRKV